MGDFVIKFNRDGPATLMAEGVMEKDVIRTIDSCRDSGEIFAKKVSEAITDGLVLVIDGDVNVPGSRLYRADFDGAYFRPGDRERIDESIRKSTRKKHKTT